MEIISEEKYQELKQIFSNFDKNNDGKINFKEMVYIIKQQGIIMNEKDLKYMMYESDLDRNGCLDFTEFCCLFFKYTQKEVNSHLKDDEILLAFQIYDQDKDGFIQGEELEDLKETLRKLGEALSEEEIEEMIQECDIDGDGKISLAEFTLLMNNI